MTWPRHSSRVRWTVSAFAVAAGVLHLVAAQQHHHMEHHHIMGFFIALGIAQLLWAQLVLTTSDPRVIRFGIVGNASVAAIWVFSRTTGIPFIVGAEPIEPISASDLAATLLEVAIVATLVYGTTRDLARRLHLRPGELGAAAMAGGLVVVAATGVLGSPVPQHAHTDAHTGAHPHDEIAHARADGHEHVVVDAAHPHADGQTEAHALAHPAGHVSSGHEGHHAAAASNVSSLSPELRGTLARIRYGPFTIGSSETSGDVHHPAISNIIRTRLQAPCTDCYLVPTATSPRWSPTWSTRTARPRTSTRE